MPQALLFRCPRCGSGLRNPDPQHASYVFAGQALCSSRCYDLMARVALPAEQLSLIFYEPSQPVLALHGPP